MRCILVLCFCLCAISCESNKYGDHPPYPTKGRVLVNGQPAKGAVVTFHHQGDWGERSIVPQAWTDDEGRFVMATYAAEDGAPAGDYQVTIEWPAYKRKETGPDKLGGQFAKPETSGLTAHIEKGKNDVPPFDLKANVIEYKPEGNASKKRIRSR
jgi:hypothetical protein